MAQGKKRQLATIQVITKLVDLLISPKTTLPWVLHALSGPVWIASMLVPIREAGALLPQWYLKTQVLGQDNRRDTYWRIGLFVQALSVLSLIPCFYLLSGINLAIGIMGLIALLSFARALTSLCAKDIQGHIVAQGERGKFSGMLSSLAGVASIVSAVILILPGAMENTFLAYLIFFFAGTLLLIACALARTIRVELDAPDDNQASISMMALLKEQKSLRRLIVQRALLLQSALMAPYFTLYALDNTEVAIGWLVLVSAIATTLSSYIWGRFADEDNLLVSRLAAALCIASGVCMLIMPFQLWLQLGLFLLLQIAHSGIRVHRKTYILDITNEQNRTAYVATANTMTGIALLLFGGIYTLLYPVFGTELVWVMLALLSVAIILSRRLPQPKTSHA
ncbi:MAG: MFS transporter [Aestuariibacter sp.]